MRATTPTLILIVAILALAAGHALADSTCKADVKVTYRGEDNKTDSNFVDHVFAVEVSSNVECAKVNYVLRVVEKPKDGDQVENRKTYTQKVRSGESKVRKVKYRLARGTQVLDYGFENAGCKPCSAP